MTRRSFLTIVAGLLVPLPKRKSYVGREAVNNLVQTTWNEYRGEWMWDTVPTSPLTAGMLKSAYENLIAEGAMPYAR